MPHVEFRPELRRALEQEGIAATFADTSAPDGYWALLSRYWAAGETFIVLEQDKFPAVGALRELWECDRPWCTFPVPMRDSDAPAPYPPLACTKFGAELMAADPQLVRKVGELDLGFGEKAWNRLDMGIAALCENITQAHWHAPGRVEHRH